jgi:hypothetical protein
MSDKILGNAQSEQINLSDLLGAKHTGMKISASGVLGRIEKGWKVDKGMRVCCGQMLTHLQDVAKKFYAGDVKIVDEFFQLYCLDEHRP